ncbi:MAG: hypothetical protein MHPDNHAH_00402 [Anaerolineales bacterium]|nr:hypothetical protein [Anaerolineales bacterium]WKZ47359.1 MAG: hypothetical protein QY306_16220 [Anaerolineales bacterium]
MISILLFILLAILSYFLVALIRRYAQSRQILDHPNQRSSHVTSTRRVTLGSARWRLRRGMRDSLVKKFLFKALAL